jgi:hypothetical protein
MKLLGVLAGFGMLLGLPYATPPLAERYRQFLFSRFPVLLPTVSELITLKFRKLIDDDEFYDKMAKLGYSRETADEIVKAAYFYPTPSDLISWTAREVFEPDAIEKYGLDAEFDKLRLDEFFKAGMTEEQVRNFWRAHWQHPSWTQIIEMMRRDVLKDPQARDKVKAGSDEWRKLREEEVDLVYDWYRLVEIPPYWRDRLTKISYEPLTRVDVRRMEDLGLLTDDELMRMYLDWGYDEENARRMVIWTKQYVALPDLLARFRNGWITLDELKEELLKLGMKEEKVNEIIETKVKNTLKPERTQRERDLTKSEIIKGVKKGILDIETAKEMLMRLGYDEFEAEYIIVVNIEAESSPETPLEFRKLVENWRKAMGLEHKEIPKEVLEAERKYLELKKRLDEAIKRKERENIIAELNSKLADAEYRYFQLLRAYRLTETK